MLPIPTRTIASKELTAATSSVTLNVGTPDLPFTHRHLVCRINARSARVATSASVEIHFNGDTTSTNYYYQRLLGIGASASAARAADDQWMTCAAASNPANTFSGGELLVTDAFSTRTHKAAITLAGGIEEVIALRAGRWSNTDAITSVSFTESTGANFEIGSTFELAVVDEIFAIPGAETILT